MTGITGSCSSVTSVVVSVTAATSTIGELAASPSAVCVGSPVTFTATVGNVTGNYAYTLSNGSSTTSGTSSSAAFSQSWIASGSGMQNFTLTISANSQRITATTVVTVNSLPIASLQSVVR